MSARSRFALLVSALSLLISCGAQTPPAAAPAAAPAPPATSAAPATPTSPVDDWKQDFAINANDLGPVGRNKYFILEPGHQVVLEDEGERVEITVTKETRVVDGVTCGVVEERESKDGDLVEISRNFFAISKSTSDVYYFGEEVDIYKKGKIVDHHGAWLAGKDGAKAGMVMPGSPAVGQKYYQEIAPGKAMDRAENKSLTEIVKTDAGEFKDVLKVEETTPLEVGDISIKMYAPEVGMIFDDGVKLVKVTKSGK